MYTTKEAAEALNVQPRTIQRYAKREKDGLPIANLANLRGDFLFREDDLVLFAKQHGLAIQLPEQKQ